MPASAAEIIIAAIDDDWLKLVKTKKSGESYSIAATYAKAIRGLPLAEVAREAALASASMKIKSRQVILVLPPKYAITKNIEVPSLDPHEIESIVRLQAVRHTPYSREEVIIGHLNLEVLLERYMRALLVIISSDQVKKRTDVLEAAGLDVQAVRFLPEAYASAAVSLGFGPPENSPTGALVIESESSDFLVLSKGLPFFIRSIPVGLKQLLEDSAGNMRQLLDEIKKTIESYQKDEQGSPLKSFWLQGSKASPVSAISKIIQEELKIPVNSVQMEEVFKLPPGIQSELSSKDSANFFDLFSTAHAEASLTMDLIPEEVKVRRSFKSKGQEIFTAGIFVLVIFALIIGIFLTKIYFRDSYLKEIQKNFEIKQKEADDLLKKSEKTRFVRDFNSKKGTALKVLDESQKVLPQQMYLSEISFSPDGKVTMKGTSELMSTVFSFVTQLDNHPLFQNVNSDYTKSRKENDKDVSDFGITANIDLTEGPPDG